MSKPFSMLIPLCAAAFLSSAAYATTSSVSCTVGAVTVTDASACYLKSPVGQISANASVTVADGMQGFVSVDVNASDSDGRYSTSSTAFADGSSEFTSSGAVRLGEINLRSTLIVYRTAEADISISDGTHTYVYNCASGNMGCQNSEVLPFFLGSNFFVTMAQEADSGAYNRGGEVATAFYFTLEEMNGTAVANQLVVPNYSASPEPSTALPMAATFLAFSFIAIKKSRSRI